MRMLEATPRAEGNRLFKRGTVSKLIFDALRANPEGLDTHQLAAIIIKEKGLDANDPELSATIRQRCMMAMYRFVDRGQIVKEQRGLERAWRLDNRC
jgi:hypothetical protein